VARFSILSNTPDMMFALPLLAYQDVLAIVIVAWVFHAFFAISPGPTTTRRVAITGWTLCLFLTMYTAIGVMVYNQLLTPLTYRLIAISDYGRGVEATIAEEAWPAARAVSTALVLFLIVAGGMWRL